MGYNVIADDKGAFVYSNTDAEVRTNLITHPHGFTETWHRQLANKIIDEATSRYGKPTLDEWETVCTEVWEEERQEYE